jgi:hypothetical protein
VSEINASDVRALYQELKGLSAARNHEYDLARRRYRGEHWDPETNPAKAGHYSLTVNYVRPAIKGAVRDLFGRMPGIQVLPQGADDEARRLAEGSEGVIYRCWEENEAEKVFRRAAHNQVLLRRGILYVWWDQSDKVVRFRSIDPANFYPLKDGERIIECIVESRRLTSELRRQYGSDIAPDMWTPEAGLKGASDVSGGLTDALADTGSVRDPTRQQQDEYTTVLDYFHRDGTFIRVVGDKEVGRQNLAYGNKDVPFIEVENDYPGDEDEPESEVPEDIVELNQYLDILVSQQADIIKKYANPTVIDQGSGVAPATVRNTIQGEAGVLPIRKDGQIRYLNWEGPQPAIAEQRQAIEGYIHDLSGRPAVSYGETVTNQSGVMTNLAMNPTVAAAADRQVLWGFALSKLNGWVLRLYEKFAASSDLSYQGYKPSGPRLGRQKYFDTADSGMDGAFKGRDIKGWYRNQIKWPSILRTDDPMYVQSIISQVTSDPPMLSVYDAIELLGHDDAEGIADRIAAQLEDPRFHPDRMTAAVGAASGLASMPQMPPGMEGLVPPGASPEGMGMGGDVGGGIAPAAEYAGNPNTAALAG